MVKNRAFYNELLRREKEREKGEGRMKEGQESEGKEAGGGENKQIKQSGDKPQQKIKGVMTTSHHQIKSEDPQQLKAALMNGPVGISINAKSFVFVHYKEGIIDWISCTPSDVGHAVLVVGYGVEDSASSTDGLSVLADSVPSKGREYFIIKNSWGEDWGEKGFARVMNSQWGSKLGICGMFSEGYQPNI